jgi:hypothetical protein
MYLEILDSISEPAKALAGNEDRIGWTETSAFVIDGATNLGPSFMPPAFNDSAWIAELARRHFTASITPDRALRDVVRELCADARRKFQAIAGADSEPWQHPNASFQMLRVTEIGVEIAGLADCALFLRDASGSITRHNGTGKTKSVEQDEARRAIARMGKLGPDGEGYRDPDAIVHIRQRRALHNTDRGSATLGIHPEAADRVRIELPAVGLPAIGLLCTDGFADIVDGYAQIHAEELIERALGEGLATLLAEIRHIENTVDPDGLRFPRYKRNDDASAILVRITA